MRRRGMYAIMEQAGHITSVRILELGLAELRLRRPEVELHLIQPESRPSPLAGPSMGFEASRAALRFGYASVKEWLGTRDAIGGAGAFRDGACQEHGRSLPVPPRAGPRVGPESRR